MDTAFLFFGISLLMSFMVWNKMIKTYLKPRIKELELKKAAQFILFLHCFRFAGLSFLMSGIVGKGLNVAWASPAAFGDLAAAILAFAALLLIDTKAFRPLLWIFNIWGFADLLLAFIQGPIYNILPFLGATYFIIIIYVPLLFLTHLTIFKLLVKREPEMIRG